MNFGSIFKGIRQGKGLTQDQAGAMLGVSRQAVSNWENDRNLPDIEMLITMADVFDLSLDELILGGKEDMNNMTEKLINDGSEVKKTKQDLVGLCIGAALVLLGFIALIVKGQFFTYTDADGYLYENTLLVLVSFASMIGGLVTFFVVGLRSFIKIVRHREDGTQAGIPTIVASVGFLILAVAIVLFVLMVLACM